MTLRVLLAIVLVGLGAAACVVYWHIGTMLIARELRQALAEPGDLPVARVVLDQAGAPELVGWVADRKGSCGLSQLPRRRDDPSPCQDGHRERLECCVLLRGPLP